jgi:tRNA pseudouridine(38-40) synthase
LGQVIALHLRSAIPLSVAEDLLPSHPCDSVSITVLEAQHQQKPQAKRQPSVADATETKSKKDTDVNNDEDQSESVSLSVEKVYQEMDYCAMLNRCLPDDIRVLGWTPVTPAFSARFSATHRTYRYFFLRKQLDVQAMSTAAQLLVGCHDFRNICKLDIANVTNFVREIFYARIECFQHNEQVPEQSVWMLEIRGIAFLWHMVRCIMALLFLVGEGKEAPVVVKELLDIDAHPAKPAYAMAEDRPLVLHGCGFENLSMHCSPRTLWQLVAHYRQLEEDCLLAAARARNALVFVCARRVRPQDVQVFVAETVDHHEKAAKRVTARALSSSSSSASASVSHAVVKRKFEAMEGSAVSGDGEGEEMTGLISWNEALLDIELQTGLTPTNAGSIHIPLLQVCVMFILWCIWI